MVERSDRMWSTGEGNDKPLQYSCLENPMNSMERQKHRTLKDDLPGRQMPNILLKNSGEITPEIMNGQSQSKNKNKNKNKKLPVVDVTGDRSKVRCRKSNIA